MVLLRNVALVTFQQARYTRRDCPSTYYLGRYQRRKPPSKHTTSYLIFLVFEQYYPRYMVCPKARAEDYSRVVFLITRMNASKRASCVLGILGRARTEGAEERASGEYYDLRGS